MLCCVACVYFEEQKASRKCSAVSLWKRPFVVHTLPGSWSGSSLYSSLISSLDTPVHRRSATATGKPARNQPLTLHYRLTGLCQRSCFPSIRVSFKEKPSRFIKALIRADGTVCSVRVTAGLSQEMDYCRLLTTRSWHLSPGEAFRHHMASPESLSVLKYGDLVNEWIN